MGRSSSGGATDAAGAAAARRRAATKLLLAFAAAGALAFLAASLAFNITHGQYVRLWGDDDASTLPGQQQQQQQQRGGGEPRDAAMQRILETRVCGSPAVDGYSHVEPPCLEASPTNKWWQEVRPSPDDLDVHIERHADYDGLAVGWGIGNTKGSVEECAEACRQHKPPGHETDVFARLPCNAFAWCSQATCFEPDAHSHSKGDCWLKFTEAPASPEVNMRGRLSKAQQRRHPDAPVQVQWHSGVVLPRGVTLTNGSWSPRHDW